MEPEETSVQVGFLSPAPKPKSTSKDTFTHTFALPKSEREWVLNCILTKEDEVYLEYKASVRD